MKRDKWKKLLGICFVIGALVFSFWYGGNAPGLQGFDLNAPMKEESPGEISEEIITKEEKLREENNIEEKKTDESTGGYKDKVTEEKNKTTEKKKNEGEGFFEKIFMQVRNTGSGNKSKNLQTSKKASKNANKATKKNNRKKSSDKKEGNDTDNSSGGKVSQKSTKKKSTEGTSDTDENDDESGSSTGKNENTEDAQTITCTISISCTSVLNHLDKLTESTRKVIPEDGVILDAVSVDIKEGSTVFDVLKKATKENNVQLEYNYTPAYKTYYIEGIGNLYEFDAGNLSGWMYSVNGTFPGVGCSGYKVKDGDIIQWHYTCNFGKDV